MSIQEIIAWIMENYQPIMTVIGFVVLGGIITAGTKVIKGH